MIFDRVNEANGQEGWAESSVVSGFEAAWDKELFGLAIPAWRKSVVQIVRSAHSHFGGGRIVVADMGCGAATYARHLLAEGIDFEYHGYDHNESVLEAACRRWELLPNENVHLHLMDLDCDRWPVEDGRFDLVIWDTTLRFCENVHRTFAESARVCRGWNLLARTPIEHESWCERVRYYDMQTPSPNWHFDESALRLLGEQNALHTTLSVGCEDAHVFSRAPFPSDLPITPIVKMERVFHEAFVRERMARLIAQHPGRWCVFGAGEHSRWLMTILPDSLRNAVVVFADEQAPRDFTVAGIAVKRPCEIDGGSLAGVLVSSDVMEEQLSCRATRWFGGDVQVHRLYANMPAGPFDKIPPRYPAPLGAMPRAVASMT